MADGQALAALGYSRDELEGKSLWEAFDAETCRILEQRYPRVLAGESLHFETPLKGHIFSSDYAPIRDANGAVIAGLVVSHDLTELKKVESDLKNSEARFRLLSETAAQLIAAEDPQQVIDQLARKVMEHLNCQAFFNFMVDSASGRLRLNASAGIPPETAKAIEHLDYGVAVCGCVARDRQRIIATHILQTHDPRTELVKSFGIQAYCCHPLIAQGELIGTLSFGTKNRPRFTGDEIEVMRTVADQVAIALQRVQAKESLESTVKDRTASLTIANRELEGRTRQLRMLAGELTMAEQRERKRLAQILHDGLQQHLAAAKLQVGSLAGNCGGDGANAAALIEEMLSDAIQLSRSLSADLSPPVLYTSGLAAALDWLARAMRDRHGLTVEFTSGDVPELPEDVKVLLFESARELLFNCAKHSGVSKAEVCIQVEDGRLQISVSDSGSGFNPQTSRLGDNGGGLGLFSIRERLALLGGELEIDSSLGNGSRFTMSVPVSAPSHSGETEHVHPKQIIRVLLVDDHALFRDGLARLCKREPDIQVLGQAGSGEEAIALAQAFNPDVILMDINMPGMNGIEATAAICKNQQGVQIIGLSMYEDESHMLSMRQAGAVDYITKGVPAPELIAAIRACRQKRVSPD